MAIQSAFIASQKKAEDIVIFNISDITFIAEYFMVCSGSNGRQLQAIADDIKKEMKSSGVKLLGLEGYTEAKWILLDLGDVIIHIFDTATRSFYDLELLWGDAPKLEWESEKP
ncbi:MAG: ribosome silencing factor [Candidatus Anammoxibacter sp.]